MAEATGTKEPQKQPKERIIQLGQEFHPFDPEYVEKHRIETDEFDSTVLLAIGNGVKIPLTICAYGMHGGTVDEPRDRKNIFLPFGPEDESYQIDAEDYKAEARLRKVELRKPINFEKNPLRLNIVTSARKLDRMSISSSEDTLNLLQRLKVEVITPIGNFENTGDYEWQFFSENDWDYDVSAYLPSGSKLLAEIPQKIKVGTREEEFSMLPRGCIMGLPSDLKKLSQLKVKFIPTPEQTENVTSLSK